MNTMSSTKFHHLLYNINILGEELYKYLCFRSNPINYLYLSMYMYVVLNYEINMFKLNTFMKYGQPFERYYYLSADEISNFILLESQYRVFQHVFYLTELH